MDFVELAESRFSVRKFSDRPVEEDKLDAIEAKYRRKNPSKTV